MFPLDPFDDTIVVVVVVLVVAKRTAAAEGQSLVLLAVLTADPITGRATWCNRQSTSCIPHTLLDRRGVWCWVEKNELKKRLIIMKD